MDLAIGFGPLLIYIFFLSLGLLRRQKHKWGDLCAFRVFPYKCHTTLQLFELDDDYIQEQIRKAPAQTTCSVSFKNQAVLALFHLPMHLHQLAYPAPHSPHPHEKEYLYDTNIQLNRISKCFVDVSQVSCFPYQGVLYH